MEGGIFVGVVLRGEAGSGMVSISGLMEDIKSGYARSVGVLDGKLYVVGGHEGPNVRRSAEVYNPDTKQWTAIADMGTCRRNAGVVSLNGLLYVVGGENVGANPVESTVEIYNPHTDTWSLLPSQMSVGRSYVGVAIIDR
ncbi:hypothetical protein J437_LFUL006515 [Ladona fulva]|uniref:Uncharacterized protein n=1 Tax=Ladona fulva TaxID=123851 RepID=A0A8K0KIG1_LADFU|nr:hypothetical protein J437_LFUL006515 [Ladona fulva]